MTTENQPKRYRLLKDLPNAKQGMIFRLTDNGEDYVCLDLVSQGSWDVCYPKKYIEENLDWFELVHEPAPAPASEQPAKLKDEQPKQIPIELQNDLKNFADIMEVFNNNWQKYVAELVGINADRQGTPPQPANEQKPDEKNEDYSQRPPLGVMPEWRWKELRVQELDDALNRYADEMKELPQEWINEKYELQKWLQFRSKCEICGIKIKPGAKLCGSHWRHYSPSTETGRRKTRYREQDWEIVCAKSSTGTDVLNFDGSPLDNKMKEIISSGKKTMWRIHSVRRISDNTTWNVKQVTSGGVIESFDIIVENAPFPARMRVGYEGGGGTDLSYLKLPEPKQKKDYEIAAFKTSDGIVWRDQAGQFPDGNFKFDEKMYLEDKQEIWAVRRLLDGELFTVGGEVKWDLLKCPGNNPKPFVIKSFEIKNYLSGEGRVFCNNQNISIDYLTKSPQQQPTRETLNKLFAEYKQAKKIGDNAAEIYLNEHPELKGQIPIEPERITVNIGTMDTGGARGIPHQYDLVTSSPITKEQITAIKNAIENCLNNEDDLVGLLRDAVSSTWGNPSLVETQKHFDSFLEKRNLLPYSIKVNKTITRLVNEIIYDKKYTQQELDSYGEKCFNAGRLGFKKNEITDETYHVRYFANFDEYKNSLK